MEEKLATINFATLILLVCLSTCKSTQGRPIEDSEQRVEPVGPDSTIDGELDGRIRFNGHSAGTRLLLKSQSLPARLVSSDMSSRQLKDQYNTFNIGYDDDYRNRSRRPYNPYQQQQQPYYPYYEPQPQPYPYPYPYPLPPTTTTTTAKPRQPQPIGYMLIDTYHSPQGQSYSRPIAYFQAKK